METIHRKHYDKTLRQLHGPGVAWSAKRYLPPALPLHAAGLSKARLNRRVYTEILHIITTYKGFIIGDSS